MVFWIKSHQKQLSKDELPNNLTKAQSKEKETESNIIKDTSEKQSNIPQKLTSEYKISTKRHAEISAVHNASTNEAKKLKVSSNSDEEKGVHTSERATSSPPVRIMGEQIMSVISESNTRDNEIENDRRNPNLESGVSSTSAKVQRNSKSPQLQGTIAKNNHHRNNDVEILEPPSAKMKTLKGN